MVGSGHRHERIPPLLVGSRTGGIRPFFHPARRPPVGRLRPSERIRGRALRSLSLRRAFFPGHAAVGNDTEVRMLFHIPGLTTSVLLIAILSLSSSLAIGADDYPSRPIKLMVGASPGGTTDTMARAIAPPLASSLGRPVLVENRPGAGGSLAADAVAKSAPDGYTLLVSFSSPTINAPLYPKLPFDPVTDFTPISMIAVTHRRVDRLTRDTMPQPDISQPIR